VTGIHRAPGESVDFVIQTILVMVFNPRLKFLFFFFFLPPPPFLFFSLNKGTSALAGFREAQTRGKTSFSQKRGGKKGMLLAFPVCEGVKHFAMNFILKGKCQQQPSYYANKSCAQPFPLSR